MKMPYAFFFLWPSYWWQLKGEDSLLPAEDSFREAEEAAFQQSGFHNHEECEAWNRENQEKRGLAHTNRGYYGPHKVAGPGHTGPVASNYRSQCPHYMGYYLGGEYPGSWTECRIGGKMTGAAWYEFCGKEYTTCNLFQNWNWDEHPVMIDRIVCPYQTTENFSFEVCVRCRAYDHHIGAKDPAPTCRKQKTKEHRRGFQAAFLLNSLGMKYCVAVEGAADDKPDKNTNK